MVAISPATLPRDTSLDADAVLFAKFASMSLQERAELMDDLSQMGTELATAGITAQNGPVEGDELRWHLCARRYGERLANEAYGRRR